MSFISCCAKLLHTAEITTATVCRPRRRVFSKKSSLFNFYWVYCRLAPLLKPKIETTPKRSRNARRVQSLSVIVRTARALLIICSPTQALHSKCQYEPCLTRCRPAQVLHKMLEQPDGKESEETTQREGCPLVSRFLTSRCTTKSSAQCARVSSNRHQRQPLDSPDTSKCSLASSQAHHSGSLRARTPG